ncbi:reverse transcriptase family protein, partial [Moritella sp.]|uniref:reverse transcriptase family protein n=1 Tax=Moritella sp. TaxID=78556 RepID=UPI0025DF1E75
MLNPGPKFTRNLKIMYQNVQGLIPLSSIGDKNPSLNVTKITELQSHIFSTKPDLVILNETWLKPSIIDSEILPSGYNIFRLDRSNYTHPTDPSDLKKFRKNGGGVLIAARCDLDMTIDQINLKCQAEILSIELKNPNGQKIIVSTLYRVGTLGISNYTRVQSYLQKIAKRRGISNFTLIGDLNLSKTNWQNSESSCDLEQSFIDMFSDLGLTQLINQPTHDKGNTLDVVLTKFPCNVSNLKVLDKDYICKSDHYGINFELNSKAKRQKSIKREIYNFKKANWTKLNEDLSKINWHRLLHTNNIEHGWNFFKQNLFENVNKHIPKIKIQSEFQPPWFDSETFELCREKERLRAQFKCDKSDASYMKFSKCRRDFKNLVKQKMNDNFCDDSNPDFINRKFWSYVKKSNNTHRIPNSVCYKNCHRTCRTDQAELFSQFFYDQFSTPSTYATPVDCNKLLSLEFHIVFDHNEICKLLCCINPNKAHGPDGIHGKILKNCAATLAKPLSILFDLSYKSGHIPEDWKLANVVPIHKKGSKNNVENYRPISLTSLIMKQFEKIIRSELMRKCENVINDSQHGFLPNKSCTTQMVRFTDSLAVSLNENYHINVVYFDFAKAFDTVNHDLLLDKLKYKYNIDGQLLRFLICYLKNRKQQVIIGDKTSNVSMVNSGVPQGSIVGPVLFVLFIDDISENISDNTDIALYADDTKIWRVIRTNNDHEILQNDINNLQNWAVLNKMKFNTSKCHIL